MPAACSLAILTGCGGGSPTLPGPPAGLLVVAGASQEGTVGAAVAIRPSVRVRDANGTGVAGISVRFDVVGGGGSVTGDSVVSDAEGIATVGEWRLGPVPGTNTLRAQAIDHPYMVNLNATASPGAPSSVQVVTGGANLAAIVAQEVIPRPQVRIRDMFGNPIPNATVTWLVVEGGGSLLGSNTTPTNAEGLATVTGWRLGPASGTNRIQARTSNGITATISALGIGIPSLLEPVSPATQSGYSDFAVPRTARVRVIDAFGANVAGLPVVFALTAGSGTITGDTVITDANGVAALGDWKLGPTGFSQVTASVPGFTGPEAVFTANGGPRDFKIEVRFVGTVSADIRDSYIAGAMRWMEVIVGDLPDHTLSGTVTSCVGTIPPTSGTIDDVVIFASVISIDGLNNILGQAGPCRERPGPSYTTVLGGMQFDIADADALVSSGRFTSVVLHEMGHVLGFLDDRFLDRGMMLGDGGDDPTFTGPQALAAWPGLGITYAGALIPLENTGGGGTRDSHWRETILDAELMTGWIEAAGVPTPLSALTIAAMADLGYVVDHAQADAFTSALRAAIPTGPKTLLREVLFRNGRRVN